MLIGLTVVIISQCVHVSKHHAIYLAAAKSLKSCPTLCDPHSRQPTRFLRSWEFPGKNTGVGCRCLLQLYTLSTYNFYLSSVPNKVGKIKKERREEKKTEETRCEDIGRRQLSISQGERSQKK